MEIRAIAHTTLDVEVDITR